MPPCFIGVEQNWMPTFAGMTRERPERAYAGFPNRSSNE